MESPARQFRIPEYVNSFHEQEKRLETFVQYSLILIPIPVAIAAPPQGDDPFLRLS
jgi:hypothetical protein